MVPTLLKVAELLVSEPGSFLRKPSLALAHDLSLTHDPAGSG